MANSGYAFLSLESGPQSRSDVRRFGPPAIEKSVTLTLPSYASGRAVQDFAASPEIVGNAITEAMGDLKMSKIERGRRDRAQD